MPHIKKAYVNLGELKGALIELKRLVLQEREDVINLNLDGLSARRCTIDQLFSRIREIHSRTALEIRLACQEFGLPGEGLVSQLIPLLEKPDREQFAALQQFIKSESGEIENELAVNRALLKDSLTFTSHSMQMFSGILKTATSSTYGQQGRFMSSVEQPRIICKEI